MTPLHEALGIWPPSLNPWFWVLHFHQPLVLFIGYLLNRLLFEPANKISRGLVIFFLCIASIGIGWRSCVGYVIYEDVLLERAILSYAEPPEDLIEYHHADGGRNAGAVALGGVYAAFVLFAWILIIFMCRLSWKLLTSLCKGRPKGRP